MTTQFIVVQVDDIKKWDIFSSDKDQFDDEKQDDSHDESDEEEYDPVSILYEKYNVIAVGTVVRDWNIYDKIQDILESDLLKKPLEEGKSIDMSSCVVFTVKPHQNYIPMITDLTWDDTETEAHSWISNDGSIEVWYK